MEVDKENLKDLKDLSSSEAGYIVGFKAWRKAYDINDLPLLLAPWYDSALEIDNPTKAECFAKEVPTEKELLDSEHSHIAPVKGCTCGYYAYYNLEQVKALVNEDFDDSSLVYALVAGWGKTQIHPEGFRSEYLKPIAFIKNEGQSISIFSQIYGVPLIEPKDCYTLAQEFGALYQAQEITLPVIELTKAGKMYWLAGELVLLIMTVGFMLLGFLEGLFNSSWGLRTLQVLAIPLIASIYLFGVLSKRWWNYLHQEADS